MAKVALVCLRNGVEKRSALKERVRTALQSLTLDTGPAVLPRVFGDDAGLIIGSLYLDHTRFCTGDSVYTGWLQNSEELWWKIGADAPEGTYAIFRSSSQTVEVLTDYAGSHTVWYAHTETLFIASTSQRAVTQLLGHFEPNPQAMSWLLSCGSLGPHGGWNNRVHRLGPDSRICLDRSRWSLQLAEGGISFTPDPVSDSEHKKRLEAALIRSVDHLPLGQAGWVVPLSGGYDSRAILLFAKRRGIRTVTWGRKSAVTEPGNDAYVAREVAQALEAEHRFFSTDLVDGCIEKLLDRFLVAGEGRTDGLLAYLDGFATWNALHASGVRAIVRGDHGFGPGPGPDPKTERQTMHFNTMARWSDSPAPPLAEFGLDHLDYQPIPESWSRRSSESIIDWRDRLYQAYRIPAYIAAQTDLKTAYVTVASPFLTRAVMGLTRSQPEHLRRGKKLFLEIVRRRDVPVPYARYSALVGAAELLNAASVRAFICDELSSQLLRRTFTPRFADYLLSHWAARSKEQRIDIRKQLRRWVPSFVKDAMPGRLRGKPLDMKWVSLRACIAAKMQKKLSDDVLKSGATTAFGVQANLRQSPGAVL